jgi:hypothetical protein
MKGPASVYYLEAQTFVGDILSWTIIMIWYRDVRPSSHLLCTTYMHYYRAQETLLRVWKGYCLAEAVVLHCFHTPPTFEHPPTRYYALEVAEDYKFISFLTLLSLKVSRRRRRVCLRCRSCVEMY